MAGNTANRRAHERRDFKLEKKISVNGKREVLLRNISLGGMCFQSAEPYDVGYEITVGNRLMNINTLVVGCTPVTCHAGDAMVFRHEVRCQNLPTAELLQERMLMDLVMADDAGSAAR